MINLEALTDEAAARVRDRIRQRRNAMGPESSTDEDALRSLCASALTARAQQREAEALDHYFGDHQTVCCGCETVTASGWRESFEEWKLANRHRRLTAGEISFMAEMLRTGWSVKDAAVLYELQGAFV